MGRREEEEEREKRRKEEEERRKRREEEERRKEAEEEQRRRHEEEQQRQEQEQQRRQQIIAVAIADARRTFGPSTQLEQPLWTPVATWKAWRDLAERWTVTSHRPTPSALPPSPVLKQDDVGVAVEEDETNPL